MQGLFGVAHLKSSATRYGLWGPFVLCSVALAALDPFLRTPLTPHGIFSFEFIGSLAQAQDAMAAWGAQGQVAVGIGLGLDYLYLLIYGTLVYLLLGQQAERMKNMSPLWARYLRFLAALVPLVVLCDALENFALIQLVLGSQQPLWAPLALGCASLKFFGLAVDVGSWLLAKVYGRRANRSHTSPTA